ncbi:MAG: TIGR03618 family F420-dependent PPOX class oxidoreductase [Chloroflexi bacterium]|nr:TIGR03618 family F420-dependent PPOX class oxidoreductase [Chloroflexota bacterium]
MVNQRSRIELTAEEQRELIDSARVMQVASIGSDGRPHLVPMWFVYDDDGRLVFTTYGSSQKVRNLERDPRMTVLLEAGTAYTELRGLSIDATAEIVRDPHRTARVLQLVGARYAGLERPAPTPGAEPPPVAHKRVTVIVKPGHIRSWDHRKL